MEIADCKVRLNGDVNNAVFKQDVTPAEVLVLRAIHGAGSVLEIKQKSLNSNSKSIEKRSHKFELRRLREKYNRSPGANPAAEVGGGDFMNFTGEGINIVNRLFPGMNPVLPVKFADIPESMLDEEGEEEVGEFDVEGDEAPVAVPARKARKARVPVAVPADEEVETEEASEEEEE